MAEPQSPATDYDLFVIGAGSGGVRAARIAASYGAKVAIAEAYRVGGTCVIRGCVPKKLYVYASRFPDAFTQSEGFGWSLPAPPQFDWKRLVAAKEAEITRLSRVYIENLTKSGVQIFQDRAQIEGKGRIRLLNHNQVLTARKILIAVGGAPSLPDKVSGLEHVITSDQIFDLPEFPHRLVVIGGGYIAVEFASLFARLGAQITLLLRSNNLLKHFDQSLRDGLRESLGQAGVDIRIGVSPTAFERTGQDLVVHCADGARLVADQVLLATGRTPQTRNLGLDTVGVNVDRDGRILINDQFETSTPDIYAVGDAASAIQLTPVAIRQGHVFADRVFGGKNVPIDYDWIPTAVFTTPEVGTVGLSEGDARARYRCVDIYETRFRSMKTILSGGDERTLLKLIVDGDTDLVLGAHILGEDAGEMAQLIAISLRLKARKADFDATMALHPSASEEFVTMRARTARYIRSE